MANCRCSEISRSWECVHAPSCPVKGCEGDTSSVYEDGETDQKYLVENFGTMGNRSYGSDSYLGGHCSVHGYFEDRKFLTSLANLRYSRRCQEQAAREDR